MCSLECTGEQSLKWYTVILTVCFSWKLSVKSLKAFDDSLYQLNLSVNFHLVMKRLVAYNQCCLNSSPISCSVFLTLLCNAIVQSFTSCPVGMVPTNLSMCMKSDTLASPYFFIMGHTKDTVRGILHVFLLAFLLYL